MRKWIVIGLLIIAAGALVFAALWQPGARSIAYHEKKFLDAFYGRQWTENVRAKLEAVVGHIPKRGHRVFRENDRLDFHEKELIRLGHFEERTFVVNGEPMQVLNTIITDWIGGNTSMTLRGRGPTQFNKGYTIAKAHDGKTEVATFRTFDGYAIIITAARREMPKWEEMIRRLDVPQARQAGQTRIVTVEWDPLTGKPSLPKADARRMRIVPARSDNHPVPGVQQYDLIDWNYKPDFKLPD